VKGTVFDPSLSTPKEPNMTTQEYLLLVIEADGPCSLRHAWNDCKFQGYTKGFVKALQSLKDARLVETDTEDGETTISLI